MQSSRFRAKTFGSILFCILTAGVHGCAHIVSEKNQETARINYDLGVASLDRGDEREAARALYLSVAADPHLPQARNALGLVLHAMGKKDEALSHYREAIALKPDFSEARNNMGILLLDMGRLDEAIAAFEAALANMLYATPYLAEGNLGWAYYQRGDTKLAHEHLENAIAAQPRFCRGYQWLTKMAWDARQHAEVVRQSERFFKHCLADPQMARGIAPQYKRQMHLYLGLGLLGEGRTHRALEEFGQCAEGGGDDDALVKRCQVEREQLRAQVER